MNSDLIENAIKKRDLILRLLDKKGSFRILSLTGLSPFTGWPQGHVLQGTNYISYVEMNSKSEEEIRVWQHVPLYNKFEAEWIDPFEEGFLRFGGCIEPNRFHVDPAPFAGCDKAIWLIPGSDVSEELRFLERVIKGISNVGDNSHRDSIRAMEEFIL